MPLVGVPKTIDNDLEGTVMTFGFDSAVACATEALDRLHTTAESHDRVMVLEVMGRYAGWIALYAGIAGGADVILIPEIPFRYDSICAKVREREGAGKSFTLVIAAGSAREEGGEFVTAADPVANREARLGGIAGRVAEEIERRTGKETRACVLGHLQRGGSPTNFDRGLCTVFGAEAVELIAAGQFGSMVAYQGSQVGAVRITEAVGRLKTVPPTGGFVHGTGARCVSRRLGGDGPLQPQGTRGIVAGGVDRQGPEVGMKTTVAVYDTKPYDRESLARVAGAEAIDWRFHEFRLGPDTAHAASAPGQSACS